jgi:hypothetical protein
MFGENVQGYDIPVLNEREVRAGAGILFFFSLTVFLGAWHADQLLPGQLMIVAFFVDFLIRVFNPRFSPSLILGRIAVAHQTPEYTAAAPKRFAWWIGLGLASIMLVTMVFLQNMSLLNFGICGLCIVLLFMESSFGICLGCIVYNKLLKKEMTLCAGGVCEIKQKEPIQEIKIMQVIVLAVFFVFLYGASFLIQQHQHPKEHGKPNHQLLHDLKNSSQTPEKPAEHQHHHH